MEIYNEVLSTAGDFNKNNELSNFWKIFLDFLVVTYDICLWVKSNSSIECKVIV